MALPTTSRNVLTAQEETENSHLLYGCINPLNIPSIVKTVLEHVTFQGLSNSRLVCRLWAEEATKLLGTRAKISIHPYTNLDDFIDLVKVHSASSITPWNATARHDYNGVMMSPKLSLGSVNNFNIKLHTNLGGGKLIEKLFRLFGNKIISTEISTDIGSRSTIWKIFCKHAYQQLHTITLTDALNQIKPAGSSVPFFVHGEFFKSGRSVLPSVKELCLVQTIEGLSRDSNRTVVALEDDAMNVEGDDENLEEILEQIEGPVLLQWVDEDASTAVQNLAILLLYVLPNLEILEIRNPREDYSTFPTVLCNVSEHLEFTNPSPFIKRINFPLNLNETEVRAMHEKWTWPLERLQLSIRPGLRFPALYTWLSSLGATLTYLDLDFVLIPLNPETFSSGTHLVNMKTLKLKNYYGSLDFLPCMKILHTLSLTNVNLSVAFREEPERSCEEMKSLEIISGHSNAGRMSFAHIYKNITKYFPKLLKFRGDYLSDSNLKIVIRQCPLIEELLLVDSVITDVGMTGIPIARCHELQSILDHDPDETVEVALTDENGGTCNEPCIADLKGLRKLHINSPRISNVSLLYGLTNCGNLHELCLSSPLITSQALINFVKKVNLKKLRLLLSRSYRISSKDVAILLVPEEQNRGFSWPTVILDGKCNACGVSGD